MTSGSQERILIVDDDLDTIRLLELALRRAGYLVVSANGYDQMMDQLRTLNEFDQKVDLILLDLMMPKMSGYEILDLIRVYFHPAPPVIILTALSGLNEAVKALERGATKYLTKPTTQKKLIATIREVLSGNVRSRF